MPWEWVEWGDDRLRIYCIKKTKGRLQRDEGKWKTRTGLLIGASP